MSTRQHKNKILVMMVFMLVVPTNVSAATITVPNDYPTIQEGINAANIGDTVYVLSGTYYEHVTIGKSLTLQGEDRNTTIIDGSGTGNVIYITGSEVNFSEFTVQNGNVGIRLYYSNHDTISNNIISNHTVAIVLDQGSCDYNRIVDCSLTNCTSAGITLWAGCDNNTYENCTASDCRTGFHVGWGHYNVVKNCKASNCLYGIQLDSCLYARVENCYVWSNNVGILIHNWGSTMYNTITQCNIFSNNVGIRAYDPRGSGGYNEIYHNDFTDNLQYQATDDQHYPNAWDDGYPSGGNYWNDYTGVDNYSGVNQDQPGSDGIGDTPYDIDDENQDGYPHMDPWSFDIDGDGIPDPNDNCPLTPNPDQTDSDGDGPGDVCDTCPGYNDSADADSDGIPDGCDTCPNDPDNDADGDGVCGDVDVCPGFDDNVDSDGDGVPDGCDNCPEDENPDQSDIDEDGVGDLCDICPADANDLCDPNGLGAWEIDLTHGGVSYWRVFDSYSYKSGATYDDSILIFTSQTQTDSLYNLVGYFDWYGINPQGSPFYEGKEYFTGTFDPVAMTIHLETDYIPDYQYFYDAYVTPTGCLLYDGTWESTGDSIGIWNAEYILVIIDPCHVTVSEDGATDSYTIVLAVEPNQVNVEVTATPNDAQIDLGAGLGIPITLTFTTANWDTPQTVTVAAVDDDQLECNYYSTINHTVASGDPAYDGSFVPLVMVFIQDNDVPCVTCPSITDNLIGYWPLDEGEGNTTADESTNSNDGLLLTGQGGGTSPQWAMGKFGSALQFDGISAYVDCGSHVSLKPTSAVTVSAWVKQDAIDYCGQIAGFAHDEGPDESGYSILSDYWLDPDGYLMWVSSGSDAHTGYGNRIAASTLGQWHHIVGTYDGCTVKVYQDGILGPEVPHCGGIDYTSVTTFKIGVYAAGNWWLPYTGLIDDVAVWDCALTSEQIAYLYNNGVGNPVPPDTDGDGVEDPNDNCPLIANPSQSDIDEDGMGDLCDICPNDALDLCDPNGSTAEEIDPNEGGTIETPDGNLVIDIDPNDISDGVTISVTRILPTDPNVDLMIGPNPGWGQAVAVYDLQPDGMVFNEPVTLTITADVNDFKNDTQIDRLGVYLWDETLGDNGEFVFIEAVESYIIQGPPKLKVCIVELDHFSIYALVLPMWWDTLVYGDLTGEGATDIDDLLIMAGEWLQTDSIADIAPPPDGDNMVNFADFAITSLHWLEGTTP